MNPNRTFAFILIAVLLASAFGFAGVDSAAACQPGNPCENPLPTQAEACNGPAAAHNPHCQPQTTEEPPVATEEPATAEPTDVPATEVPATAVPTDVPATEVPATAVPTDVPATEVPATAVPTDVPATEEPGTETTPTTVVVIGTPTSTQVTTTSTVVVIGTPTNGVATTPTTEPDFQELTAGAVEATCEPLPYWLLCCPLFLLILIVVAFFYGKHLGRQSALDAVEALKAEYIAQGAEQAVAAYKNQK